jgi:L-ascorbate metabolism protein UlaG (beta-lactamase superfamily)
MIEPSAVIPIHYDTFDLVAQDPERFRQLVGSTSDVVVISPGGSYDL